MKCKIMEIVSMAAKWDNDEMGYTPKAVRLHQRRHHTECIYRYTVHVDVLRARESGGTIETSP